MAVRNRKKPYDRQHRCLVWLVFVAVISGAFTATGPAAASETSFVGVLAVAIEQDVAAQLGLSDEVKAKLTELINQREDEALEMVMAIRDLPPAEQTSRLLPFVRESERQGFELLTMAQRARLQQIQVSREGMASLAEPAIAESLQLSAEQRTQISQMLSQRAQDMTTGSESERRITKAIYERKLAALLDTDQRATWEKMAGLAAADSQVAQAPVAATVAETAVVENAPAEATPTEATTMAEEATTEEAATEEATTEQATTEEATTEQATTEQATTEQATTEEAMTEEATTEAAATEEAATEAAATEEATTEEAATEAAATEAATTEAAATEAATTEAATTEAATTEAATTEETATEGAMTEEATTEEATTEEATTEQATEGAMTEEAATEEAMTEEATTEEAAADTAEAAGTTEDAVVVAQPAAGPLPAVDEEGLRFNFYATPWKEVLEWFATQAGLSLNVEVLPVGSLTYRDDQLYTVDEALDLLNGYLLTKGYTLVRRHRMLHVLDLESPIPEELVTLVTMEELDERGRYELVKCLFPLAKMKAEDAAVMVENYLGPQGAVVPFPMARQILVTETGGKLRTIRNMIQRVEDPEAGGAESILEINLEYASAEEILSVARPLLGLGEGENTSGDISISTNLLGTQLFATGEPEKLQLLKELIPRLDTEPVEGEDVPEPEKLKLATYYIKDAEPEVVMRVLQTLLANLPGVRLDLDPTSGKLVAMAREAEHTTIKETIALLEGQSRTFEVIQLNKTDPQLAVAAVNKFFNLTTGDSDAAPNPDDPIVDGDPISMQLWVRGTEQQIQQIKDLVAKLEGPEVEGAMRSNVRLLPYTGPAAEQALQTIEQFWDRGNRIRMVTPSNLTPSGIRLRSVEPMNGETPAEVPAGNDGFTPGFGLPPGGADFQPFPPATGRGASGPMNRPAAAQPVDNRSAARTPGGTPIQFASQLQQVDEAATEEAPAGAGADIRVAITPSGLLIASEDLDALDALEEMLRTVSGPTALAPPREITVFYLKYAKADVAYQLVQEILGGHTDTSAGSLLGDMTSSLLGGSLIGGLLGGMSGTSSGGTTTTTLEASGMVTIVPDPRLNALIVEANETDLKLIEDLLKVIDREDSMTEVETAGAPRVIQCVYISAADAAEVIKQVYADRIGGSGGQQRQPSAEDFIRALRGGGGGRGGQQEDRGEAPKMTVGVDTRNNAVIITATEQLFQQVELLVQQIDQPGDTDTDVVTIVPIKVSNAEVVQKTLDSILSQSTTSSGQRSSSSGGGAPSGTPSPDDIRRRIEAFQQMRGAFGGGGPPGGGFGGGPPSGGFSGRGGSSSGRGGSSGRGR